MLTILAQNPVNCLVVLVFFSALAAFLAAGFLAAVFFGLSLASFFSAAGFFKANFCFFAAEDMVDISYKWVSSSRSALSI